MNTQRIKKNPAHYSQELQILINKYNHFPTHSEFRKEGKRGLLDYIGEQGGTYKVAEQFDCAPKTKPDGYWTKEKILKETQPFINNDNRFPTQLELKQAGRTDLSRAIATLGGTKKLCQEFKIPYKNAVFAKDGDNVGSLLECYVDDYLSSHRIAHEIQPLITPGRRFKADFKVGDYWIEVLGYRKTDRPGEKYYANWREKLALYKKMGRKLIVFTFDDFDRKPPLQINQIIAQKLPPLDTLPRQSNQIRDININVPKSGYYWQSFERASAVLLPICQELGQFPTGPELKARGLGGLINALYQYHGGPYKIAESLGYPIKHTRRGYWTIKIAWKEMQNLISIYGRLPTYPEICKEGKRRLLDFIPDMGGREEIAKHFGCSIGKRSTNFWTKEVAFKDYRSFKNQLGRYPKQKEFVKLGRFDLLAAIYKHGNLTSFKEMWKTAVKGKTERPILV